MPEISVVVPVYNCEKYLRKCINSILSQTFSDLELILVNDGSTDKSPEICDEFKLNDKRVKVIHQENKGVSGARNAGLDIAKGNYVGFVDSDDYLSDDMYEFLYNNLKKAKADVSICGIINCFLKNDGKEERKKQTNFEGSGILTGEEALSESLKSTVFSVNPVNKLFDIHLFDNERFPENKTSEDAFLIPVILSKAKKVVYDSNIKYYYVRHENSITTSEFSVKDMFVIEAYSNHLDWIVKKYPKLIKAAEFRYIWSYIYVLDKMIISEKKVKSEEYNKILNFVKKNILKIIFNPYFSLKRKIAVAILFLNQSIYKKMVLKLSK